MPNNENSLFTGTAGETFATKTAWRRKKAEEQPRDANGRWIADGARITYKDELLGKRVAATVVSTADGDAIVERDNPDGTTTNQKVPNNTVEVVSSKARIPKGGTSIYDKNNDFDPIINSKKFKDSLKKDGQAVIKREDGYQLEASSDVDPAEADINRKNPIAYQLFAPGGKSLGMYNSKASKSFNDMVEDDKAGGVEEDTTPVEGESPEGALFANSTIVRVSRDSSLAILKDGNGQYRHLDLSTYSVGHASSDLSSMLSKDKYWRRPVAGELESVRPFLSLSSDGIIASAAKVTPYRVPSAVKSEIASALSSIDTSKIPARDLETVITLANSEAVSIDEVQWINSFLSTQEETKKLAGGPKGQKWASKILSGFEDNVKHDFVADKFSYYAIGDGTKGWSVSDIIAVDFATDEVYLWTDEGFTLSDKTVDEVDEPILLPIDEFSAETLSSWIDSGREGGVFNLADIDPVERNLVELALSELNFDELDEIGSIVASGGAVVDVDGYTPAERSQNAKNQPRAGGGKFGQKKDEPVPTPEEKEVKARLEQELPLIDPAARIVEWLATAPVTAAATPQEAAAAPETAPVDAAPVEAEEPAAEEESSADTGESKSLYFAIVDEVDKTSVLDAIAITKNDLGEPEAWKRMGADWVPAPEILAQFNGTTPPPVVELEVPEPAKAILSQVDSHDAERGTGEEPPAEAAAPVEQPLPVAASSGFALSNGQWSIFSLTDLTNAIEMLPMVNAETQPALKQHLRKRAFAMNRMDLIPADWRTATLAERGEQLLNTSPLYGEHGEVLVAAGVPGVADTPSDWASVMRLQNYWTRGKGAAKIRWGTPGDLTRAHRHLAKYVGPQRAWGLAQKFHKAVFGVYNHTHDVATGQYKPRRKKRR